MTTLLTFLLLMAPQAAAPKTTNPPSLVVQVVDPAWLPIPGASVSARPSRGKKKPSVVETDEHGYAKFWLTDGEDYEIEAKEPGFKTKRLKNLHLFTNNGHSETAHVQLQLKLAGPFTTVY